MTRIHHRVGQIVPSSNTTMETEIPAMLRAREGVLPERFTFHSSRMRMKHVTQEELARMDADSDRCALELSDARVDVLGYACLVAIMAMGRGYHRVSEQRLGDLTRQNQAPAPVVTSAGALVQDRLPPVVSSSVCTTWRMLQALNLSTTVPDAGALLSGGH